MFRNVNPGNGSAGADAAGAPLAAGRCACSAVATRTFGVATTDKTPATSTTRGKRARPPKRILMQTLQKTRWQCTTATLVDYTGSGEGTRMWAANGTASAADFFQD